MILKTLLIMNLLILFLFGLVYIVAQHNSIEISYKIESGK